MNIKEQAKEIMENPIKIILIGLLIRLCIAPFMMGLDLGCMYYVGQIAAETGNLYGVNERPDMLFCQVGWPLPYPFISSVLFSTWSAISGGKTFGPHMIYNNLDFFLLVFLFKLPVIFSDVLAGFVLFKLIEILHCRKEMICTEGLSRLKGAVSCVVYTAFAN